MVFLIGFDESDAGRKRHEGCDESRKTYDPQQRKSKPSIEEHRGKMYGARGSIMV